MSRPNFIVALCMAVLLVMASGLLAADPPLAQQAAPAKGGERPLKKPHPSAVQKAPAKRAPSSAVPVQRLRSGEAAIEEALAKLTQLEFVETPLSDVIDFLKDQNRIEIQLDTKALVGASIGADTPVTINLRGVSLRSALKLMLRQLNLTWTIRDDVLLITTPEEDENNLCTKLYDVSDLVVCRDKHDKLWDDYEPLIDLITSTVKPCSWDCVGGPASIAGASLGKAKILVVDSTYRDQADVANLLAEIRKIAEKNPSGELPRRDPPPCPPKPKEPPKSAPESPGAPHGGAGTF